MPGARRDAPPIVDCPGCGRKVEFSPGQRWRPFCSQRCRNADLGAWASGAYVVKGPPLDDAPGQAERDDAANDER